MTMSAILKRAALLWVILLTACTIQLVPSYDQALVEGLDAANTQALTLFAAVESGATAEKFADYEQTYSEVIGTFDALRQRAANRQVPPLAKRLSETKIVSEFCNAREDPTGCVNVSPASLDRVLAVLRQMRDRHRRAGLQTETVDLFRRDYSTAIAQALTVENALKR